MVPDPSTPETDPRGKNPVASSRSRKERHHQNALELLPLDAGDAVLEYGVGRSMRIHSPSIIYFMIQVSDGTPEAC